MAGQHRVPRYRTVDVRLPRQGTRYRPKSPRITSPADLPALPRTHPVPRARPDDGRTVRNLGRHDRGRPQTTHQPSSPRRATTPRAPARDTGHRRRPSPELRPVTTASSAASRRPHHPTENPGSAPECVPDQQFWTTHVRWSIADRDARTRQRRDAYGLESEDGPVEATEAPIVTGRDDGLTARVGEDHRRTAGKCALNWPVNRPFGSRWLSHTSPGGGRSVTCGDASGAGIAHSTAVPGPRSRKTA
ncbi:Uncharacterised protein [Rhodococcus wratislaviensis]|uniref:Uncharacterized protein n=1 Tax=Rhodococcus wratislaviensis TaxID=44752 RepID=A0AB38F618_RHOWR|nr:Uncharacterised protein [Rhodococcus wratislaviensis]